MSRSYSRLADWGDGWILMSCPSWDGPKGKELNKKKQNDGMLPAGPAHLWLADPLALADRLEVLLGMVVTRYNGQVGVKQAQTYREPICTTTWRNAKGKLEETIFELQFSSYGFHQTNVTKRVDDRYKEGGDVFDDIYRDAVITPKDVRVIIKLKTTVSLNNQTQQATPNTRSSSRKDNYNQDRRGYNVPAPHFLHGLRQPQCRIWISEVAAKIRESRERRGLPAHSFPPHCQLPPHLYKPFRNVEAAQPLAATPAAAPKPVAVVTPSVHPPKVAKMETRSTATTAAAAADGGVVPQQKEEGMEQEQEEEEEIDLEEVSTGEEEEEEEEEEEDDDEDEETEDDSQEIYAPEHLQQSSQAVIGDADKNKKEGE
jgi:hypothetical protein